jgi:hypothetical protein
MGADRIQAGPLNSSGTNPFDQQALYQDTLNNDLYISGSSRMMRLLSKTSISLPAQVALSAITTAQTLFSENYNAGALNYLNRRIRVSGSVIYSTTAANVATISFALVLAGVTLCTITTAATNTTASANLPIQFEFELCVVTLGAAATIESHGRLNANIGTVAAAAIATYLDTNTAVSAAVNLLGAATLSVTIAASAAIPSAQLRSVRLEKLY